MSPTAPQLAAFRQRAIEALGEDRVAAGVSLAPFTTFKVGGPADVLVETRSGAELIRVVQMAAAAGVPVTVLGGGSNVLIADAGVRGVVIRPRGGTIRAESPTLVRADAGITVNGLVRWLIGHGLAGLEAWAGTPGTVGGGVYGNAHWGGRLLSEHIERVRVVGRGGGVVDRGVDEMEFGYDRSRLQRTGEILVSAVFRVRPGDPAILREEARRSLAYRKRTQPLASPSAGCIFQNPSDAVRMPDGVPRSAGALVDRAGLKGASEGGAQVSTTHGNFIVNTGMATAADIARLVARCRAAVQERFGIALSEEIVYLGDFASGTGGGRVDAAD